MEVGRLLDLFSDYSAEIVTDENDVPVSIVLTIPLSKLTKDSIMDVD